MPRTMLIALWLLLMSSSAFAQLFGNGPELTSLSDFKDGKFQYPSVKKSIYWNNITMEGRRSIERAEKAWIPAQLLMPANATGKVPAIVLIHGIGGLYYRDGSKRGYFDYADALAKSGVAVMVVDTHGGRGLKVMNNSANNAISVYTFVADAFAALDMLRTHPGIDGERIGLMGFSKGGLTSLLATDERFGQVLSKDAATFKLHIALYTGCQVYPENVRPTRAPVLLLIGAEDTFTGTKLCFPVVRQMEQAGIPVKLVVYPGASHGWDNPNQTRIDGDVSTEDCQYVLKDESGRVWAEGKPVVTAADDNAYLKRCTKPGVFYIGRNENAYRESLRAVVETAKVTLSRAARGGPPSHVGATTDAGAETLEKQLERLQAEMRSSEPPSYGGEFESALPRPSSAAAPSNSVSNDAVMAPAAAATSSLEEQLERLQREMGSSDPAPDPVNPIPWTPSADARYPTGTYATCWQEPNKIGCFTNMDKVFSMRDIRKGTSSQPLPERRQPVTYRYANVEYKAADFLDHHRILGLLILKNGEIVEEQYRHSTGPATRFYSASMAKTVVGMLVGIALEKGMIKSLDHAAERYVPELAGSAYGKATIAQLLRMSSGVRMTTSTGRGDNDEDRFFQTERALRPQPVIDFLREIPGGEFRPGSKFRYVSTDSVVLGYVLTKVSGKTVSQLCSEWIWQYIGADQDAQWRLMKDGVEYGGGDIFATMRDYGRLGIFLANDGKVGGKSIIPAKWIEAATDADDQPYAFKPLQSGSMYGYGYQTWIFPLRTRTFALRGAYGQSIYVQPKSGIVMVITGALTAPAPANEREERLALWTGVLRSLDGYNY